MRTITFLILMFFLITNINAQDLKKIANNAADDFCKCVNETYSSIDDDVMEVIIKIAPMSEKEQNDYLDKIDKKLKDKFVKQASQMEAEAQTAKLQVCADNFSKIFDDNDFENEDEVIDIFKERLKSKKKCKFAHLLMSNSEKKQ